MLKYLLALSILFLPLSSCTQREKPKNDKPTVLVSICPYAYFVRQIGKDLVHVETLVPYGANPHIYEATPKQVLSHQNAALWVYLGEPLDQKALQFFRSVKHPVRIIPIADGIELLSPSDQGHSDCHHQGESEGKDLHIWLSPLLAKQQARSIAEGLKTLLPDKQGEIEANLRVFLVQLDDLHRQIGKILLPMKGEAILVSHPALGYFCKEYGIEQLSIEMEGKDPLPQDVAQILSKAKAFKVRKVLTEPQYNNKGAELIARSLNLQTHQVDPYAENYLDNLLHIANAIAD